MKKRKPWQLSRKEREAVTQMSRTELERQFIAQQEQINRFLRVMLKLRDSIASLQSLGF